MARAKAERWLLVLAALIIACSVLATAGATSATPAFQRIQITDVFWSEGAHAADFNRDGKIDLCAGPHWYAGPDFKVRHDFTAPPATPYVPEKYSD